MDIQAIQQIIFYVRGQKVILDFHLAELYEVETKILKQAVRRNIERFPDDFMFELTKDEINSLIHNIRSQIVTFNWPSITYTPFAFTEQGVAMLSSVLRSERAIKVNIEIIRAFVFLRKIALQYAEIWQKINELEQKYDEQFKEVFTALKLLLEPQPRKQIGFKRDEEN
ncbi:MAG: ORF6N domain-containing protein [Bacteroidales bacterium]|nr:ORF6N domain-containing protein [Bacteroidales bacterium]